MTIKPWTGLCGDCGKELTYAVNSGSGLVVACGPKVDGNKKCCWKTFGGKRSRELKDLQRAPANDQPTDIEEETANVPEPVQRPEADRGPEPGDERPADRRGILGRRRRG